MLIYDWNLLVALVFGARVTSVPDSHVLYTIFIHCLQWPWVIRLRVLMDENGCVALRLWFETWKFTVLPQVKVWLQNEIAANLCSSFLNQNEIAANLRLGNCASVNYCNPVYTLPISSTRQLHSSYFAVSSLCIRVKIPARQEISTLAWISHAMRITEYVYCRVSDNDCTTCIKTLTRFRSFTTPQFS